MVSFNLMLCLLLTDFLVVVVVVLNCRKQVVLSHWSVIFRPFNNGKYHRDYLAMYLDYTHWSWSFCLLLFSELIDVLC